MAKRKTITSNLQRLANKQSPPAVLWKKNKDGDFVPIVSFANIVIPLDPRPFKGYFKGERDAVLVWIKQALSEVLFGVPLLLVHPKTGMSARNPDWELQPYFEKHPTEINTYREITPRPSAEQEAAGDKLPSI